MAKKPKFKPVVTRVKLNPEQAVLTCTCYSSGLGIWMPGTKCVAIGGGVLCDSAKNTNQLLLSNSSTGYQMLTSGASS